MKQRLLWIAFPLLGALAMGGCQKEELSPLTPSDGAQAVTAHGALGQRNAELEQNAFMAQFMGLPSGYEDYINRQSVLGVRYGEELPTGRALMRYCPPPPLFADSVKWEAVISDVDSIAEVPLSAWGPRERAMAMAMQSAYVEQFDGDLMEGKVTELDRFPDPDDEEGWKTIPALLEPSHTEFPPDVPQIGRHVVLNDWTKDGDIYVKYASDASSKKSGKSVKHKPSLDLEYTPNESGVNMAILGHWKHAAIMDSASRKANGINKCLLSASNRTDTYLANPGGYIGRVGYDMFVGYWDQADDIGVYRITVASDLERHSAVKYAYGFYTKPFDFFTSRSEDDAFYCSKLVFRGWNSLGYDLEPRFDSFTGKPWECEKVFDRWGETVIDGRITYYPIFRVVWYKDLFVTPTDLTETDYVQLLKRYHR